ncbi:aromatic ring-opening dioxygenase LigA [Terrabacter sp. Root85]|uniref:hypothetical protein n=1 Tax=unclassified Terrabacter TaxID=2630222 RepID=UPI00070093C4|nr:MULTISPECIES: hypothetical protein [unclassified Terrabacter]KRC92460.1 aromatic ring-opening dioxygenase LigA [Terrabacter sp. Root85]KRF44253.1 aromatic ring-opening dioxygenase LigA [Terrabacter sp. Soil811]
MSTVTPTTSTTSNRLGSVAVIGTIVIVIGVIMVLAGGFTWYQVQSQLASEKITVSEDAARFAGQPVNSPWTAYSEAETIEKHALAASGGKTYAELPKDDPNRQVVMTGSFLRASLFTSVLAFGVAFMAFGVGIVLVLVGIAFRRVARA